MKSFHWPAEFKTIRYDNDDGPWLASFPEEGDTIDQSVFICHDQWPGWEMLEMTRGTLAFRIRWAKRIASLLNLVGAKLCAPS